MKSGFLLAATYLFFVGCASTTNVLPEPPTQAQLTQSRNVASVIVDQRFEQYFASGNYLAKLNKVNNIAKQFLASMPENGHAKKRLVKQFVSDLSRSIAELSEFKDSNAERFTSWVPKNTADANYKAKIRILGGVIQSSKVMEQMGIYLTASGVIEPDSAVDDYYYIMMARAIGLIESEISKTGLAYLPEHKEQDENNARLRYAKRLGNDVRSTIRKSFQSNKAIDTKRVDRVLLLLSRANTLQQASVLLKSPDYRYTQSAMQGLHIMNSQDISGFEHEVELTLSTKFSFEMIHELISKVR
jgi:hypothetical protein